MSFVTLASLALRMKDFCVSKDEAIPVFRSKL